jgi:hypothetical protein
MTHNGPRKEERQAKPDGHPPIGDLDALTEVRPLTIVNCPSKKPTAAFLGSRISAYVLRESHGRRKARQANWHMQPCGVAQPSCCSSSTVYRSGRVDQDAADALLRQFLPKWPDGNTCAGIRSTYSCWIGGSQLQGIVEPNG